MIKQTFINSINAIRAQMKYDRKFAKRLSKCFPNAYTANLLYDNGKIIDTLIQVLQEATNDTLESKVGMSWIEWFIYEKDFGKSDLQAFKNGAEVKMDNSEDLWNFLMEEWYLI